MIPYHEIELCFTAQHIITIDNKNKEYAKFDDA